MIVIVGVGALGSHLVQYLRNCESAIRVVDFDRVETKNVASQFHAKTSVGKAKVVALQQTMNFLFGTKIETNSNKVVSENIGAILNGADLIIDCLDNAVSRKLIQEYVRTKSIPCLHGALAADGGFGRVIWDEDFNIDVEDGTGTATCEDGAHLPFIGIVGCYMAYAVQQFLLNGRKIGYQVSPAGSIKI